MPGIFTLDASGSGLGAILNQDGTINGPQNPAGPGSIIVIYATGGGLTDPAYEDGELSGLPLPYLKADVEVEIAGRPAEVLYAGGAPGLVAGVVQINARVPADVPATGPHNVTFKAAGVSSQTVSVIIGN
jgi:uncharacterized protein (TIGR03437 family)